MTFKPPIIHLPESQEIIAFMRKHSFATLIGSNKEGFPAAVQIPILIEEREDKLYLLGHFVRKTEYHQALEENPNALCLFAGAHAYISASWYTTPQMASTWNYMSVQVKGKVEFLGQDGLVDILEKTTRYYENDPASPAGYDQLPKDYVEKLSKGIIAFEMEITAWKPKFKLSQNRDQTSYENIIRQLEKGDPVEQQVAIEMKERQHSLFN